MSDTCMVRVAQQRRREQGKDADDEDNDSDSNNNNNKHNNSKHNKHNNNNKHNNTNTNTNTNTNNNNNNNNNSGDSGFRGSRSNTEMKNNIPGFPNHSWPSQRILHRSIVQQRLPVQHRQLYRRAQVDGS